VTKRAIRDVRGSVHDVARLKTLGTEPCNVVAVSDTTLNIIQNYAIDEVTFTSRFGVDFSGGKFEPIGEGHEDFEFVLDVIRRFRQEVDDMSCDFVEAINNLTASVTVNAGGGCGCDVGNDVDTDDGEEGGELPGLVLEVPYEEADEIESRKCLAANYIHMSVRDVVHELEVNRADSYGYAGIVFVLSLVSTIVGTLLAGPFGLMVGAVVGSFLSMAVLLFKGSFDLSDLSGAIESDEDGAVCALYEATTASGARDAYVAHLVSEGATSIETEFTEYLLPNNLMNLLFFAWGDSEATIEAVTPVSDCVSCLQPCSFELQIGTGDITYDGEEFVLSSEPDSGQHRIRFQIPMQPADEECNREVEVVSATYETGGPNYLRELYCMTDEETYDRIFDGQGDAFPTGPQDIAILDAKNGDPWTITITVEMALKDPCEA
jgi:hypothetical protein